MPRNEGIKMKIRCRACNQEIEYENWKEHVKAHKIKFCLKYNLDPEQWYEVEWENVIRAFNPDQAKPRPEEEKNKNPDMKLTKFIKIMM